MLTRYVPLRALSLLLLCIHLADGRLWRVARQAPAIGSSQRPSPVNPPNGAIIPPPHSTQSQQPVAQQPNQAAGNGNAGQGAALFHRRTGPVPSPQQAQEQFFQQHQLPQAVANGPAVPTAAHRPPPSQQTAIQQQQSAPVQAAPAANRQQEPLATPPPQPTSSSPSIPQSTPAIPEATPRIVPPPVDRNVDLDGDGALSVKEVQYAAFVHHGLSSSVVENLFHQVDKNGDDYLTSIEFNEIRPLVLAKAENAALRYMQNVDLDHNGLLSLPEAQAYILKEYGISNRDVERIWRLVVPSTSDEMDAVLFSKLRRRIRGMSIRLARQIMKTSDKNDDGHIDLREAQSIAFEQEGIGAGDVTEMVASVDDNNDGELNAPELADFERIVRSRAVETAKRALKVVDTDGSGTLTMDEAKRIAFDHYGFDEATLEPFFAQADENEDGQLDAVEFAGFRSVIRARAVKNALGILPDVDEDADGLVSKREAEQKARREDDMDSREVDSLFVVADQDRSGLLDKVELADFVRLVRLSAIKYVNEHFKDYDINKDKLVTIDELEQIVRDRYRVEATVTKKFFDKVDVDRSGDLNAGEIVDFRHEIRRHVADRAAHDELEVQSKREMAEIEAKLKDESPRRHPTEQPTTATVATTTRQTTQTHVEATTKPAPRDTDKKREGMKSAENHNEEEENESAAPRTAKSTSQRRDASSESDENEAENGGEREGAPASSTPTTPAPTTTTTESTTTATTTIAAPSTTTTAESGDSPTPMMRKHKKGRSRSKALAKQRDQAQSTTPNGDSAAEAATNSSSITQTPQATTAKSPEGEAPASSAASASASPSTEATTEPSTAQAESSSSAAPHEEGPTLPPQREPALPREDEAESALPRKKIKKHRVKPSSGAAPTTSAPPPEQTESAIRENTTAQVEKAEASTGNSIAPSNSSAENSTNIHASPSPAPEISGQEHKVEGTTVASSPPEIVEVSTTEQPATESQRIEQTTQAAAVDGTATASESTTPQQSSSSTATTKKRRSKNRKPTAATTTTTTEAPQEEGGDEGGETEEGQDAATEDKAH